MQSNSTKWAVVLMGCGGLPGCGNSPEIYPTQILQPDGSPLYVEDVQAIINDDTLTDEEKAQQIRDLGIEDEELIRAILGL
jgi:hypothetical protein